MPITPKKHGDKNLKEKQDLGYLVVSKKKFCKAPPFRTGRRSGDIGRVRQRNVSWP
jgi:hypothetical protein